MNNIKKKTISLIIMIALIILSLPTYGCGMRSTVQVQVIDAETKQPIDNAVVLIYWLKPETFLFMRYPGTKEVELKETVSDKNGYFAMPRYGNKDYEYILTIYKKGYVCWNNEIVFPTNARRTDFMLKNGVVIAMDRFKEEYSKLEHAGFVNTCSVAGSSLQNPSVFNEAIKEEKQLYLDWYRKLDKKWTK
ncbi:MAG: hypothetical protein AB7Y74_14755 [Syntrophorhabdus sp.]